MSAAKEKLNWLLLLFRLPATQKAERVAIWRKLKRSGAIPLTTSTYLLPDLSACHETFQWLTKQIRDAGGDATLVRAKEIEGFSDRKLIDLFNAARDKEYIELSQTIRALGRRSKPPIQFGPDQIERFRRRFREIREADFFAAPHAAEVEVLLQQLEQPRATRSQPPPINRRAYRNRIWMTRPRPEIDRTGSAWLIRRFIDPKARFVFRTARKAKPNAVLFDIMDADFSHEGEDCTFETLVRRFGLQDTALAKIAEMIHDADLNDGKFQRDECIGIDRALKGWAREGLRDEELLKRGALFFDGLYAYLQKR